MVNKKCFLRSFIFFIFFQSYAQEIEFDQPLKNFIDNYIIELELKSDNFALQLTQTRNNENGEEYYLSTITEFYLKRSETNFLQKYNGFYIFISLLGSDKGLFPKIKDETYIEIAKKHFPKHYKHYIENEIWPIPSINDSPIYSILIKNKEIIKINREH